MKPILVALFLAFLAPPDAYAQTPTPTQAIIPAGGVQHVWTVDDVTGTSCVTSINERGTSGLDVVAIDQVNCGASTSGTPRPDGGPSLKVFPTPGDYYQAPTPVPTIAPPYAVLALYRNDCIEAGCRSGPTADTLFRGGLLLNFDSGDRFITNAGSSGSTLIGDHPGFNINDWTIASIVVNGAGSRQRYFQPATGWAQESDNIGSTAWASNVDGLGLNSFRFFANVAGNGGMFTGHWAATLVIKVDDANDPDIGTAEQWLIDEYMITPTPTNTAAGGTPTPTITPTGAATDTPTPAPTATPTAEGPSAGCCRSEVYTVP